jgi:hypothetical protein
LCRDHINNDHIDIDYTNLEQYFIDDIYNPNIHDNRDGLDSNHHDVHAASLPGWFPWLRQREWHLRRRQCKLAM